MSLFTGAVMGFETLILTLTHLSDLFSMMAVPHCHSMAKDFKELTEENKRILQELKQTKSLLVVSCSPHMHGSYVHS